MHPHAQEATKLPLSSQKEVRTDAAPPHRQPPRTKENLTLEELMKTWMAKMEDNCLFISAREKINLEELKSVVYARVKELHVQKYPYNDFLYQTYEEEEE